MKEPRHFFIGGALVIWPFTIASIALDNTYSPAATPVFILGLCVWAAFMTYGIKLSRSKRRD
jgi:hypothetical protein